MSYVCSMFPILVVKLRSVLFSLFALLCVIDRAGSLRPAVSIVIPADGQRQLLSSPTHIDNLSNSASSELAHAIGSSGYIDIGSSDGPSTHGVDMAVGFTCTLLASTVHNQKATTPQPQAIARMLRVLRKTLGTKQRFLTAASLTGSLTSPS